MGVIEDTITRGLSYAQQRDSVNLDLPQTTDSETARAIDVALRSMPRNIHYKLRYQATGDATSFIPIKWAEKMQTVPTYPIAASVVHILDPAKPDAPVPSEAIASAAATASGTASGPVLHDTTHSPLGLWQCDDLYYTGSQWALPDSSGNGYEVSTGSGAVSRSPGRVGLAARIATYAPSTTDTDLGLTGAMSFYGWVFQDQRGATRYIVSYMGGTGADETEAGNVLYSLAVNSSGRPFYFSEHGAGVDDIVTATMDSSDAFLPLREWAWVGFTRGTGGTPDLKLYINGAVVNDSATVTSPTGGDGSPVFALGTQYTSTSLSWNLGRLQSMKLVESELTEAQMLAEYERCLGKGGTVSSSVDLDLSAVYSNRNFRKTIISHEPHILVPEPAGLDAGTIYEVLVQFTLPPETSE